MPSIRATDSSVVEDILVVGFARDKKSKKFSIASGDLKVDKTPLLEALDDLGATGAADEVIKLPGNATKLVVLTGLGEAQSGGNYPHEILRRAAGAAARSGRRATDLFNPRGPPSHFWQTPASTGTGIACC